uniref:Cytosolic Fe-S cluster assembly factor NUBP1 homolog n=1 Tax=Lotharella oceanica TaxID=641309 RepID=A0A7S2TUE2_9EUKA
MAGKASACAGCPNQQKCASGKGAAADPSALMVREKLFDVKHTILVLSGKGGVGKSTVASQLAWGLAETDAEVGILDIDICGPSMPRMMGVEDEEVHKSGSGWSPVMAADNLAVMSVGFMLGNKSDAVIWRGPRKTGLIKQFLTDVDWGKLDYLIIDAPPGTSDEHISIAKLLKEMSIDGAVIVTTPQEIALLDVRKEISFCRKTKIPIMGVIENMSGFQCPKCQMITNIFPPVSGGAQGMCKQMNVPYLGHIPLDSKLLESCEKGESFLGTNRGGSPAIRPLQTLVGTIAEKATGTAPTFPGDSKQGQSTVSEKGSTNGNAMQVEAKDGTSSTLEAAVTDANLDKLIGVLAGMKKGPRGDSAKLNQSLAKVASMVGQLQARVAAAAAAAAAKK